LLAQQVAAARQVHEHRINSTNIRHVTKMAHVSNRVSDSISYSWSAPQTRNHAPEKVGREMDMAKVKCNKCQLEGHFARNCSAETQSASPLNRAYRKPLFVDIDERHILIYGLVIWNSSLSQSSICHFSSQLRNPISVALPVTR
jgi:hypothetical protein